LYSASGEAKIDISPQKMSTHLSQEQIKRLCEDLVYQVGYAFYDVPYIILLNLMVLLEV
jgi:transcription initiation factor TFIIE subunit alpha